MRKAPSNNHPVTHRRSVKLSEPIECRGAAHFERMAALILDTTPCAPHSRPSAVRTSVLPADTSEAERACLHAGQVVERLCPKCGLVALPPRRRLCDSCKASARRATWRREKKRQRFPRVRPVLHLPSLEARE